MASMESLRSDFREEVFVLGAGFTFHRSKTREMAIDFLTARVVDLI